MLGTGCIYAQRNVIICIYPHAAQFTYRNSREQNIGMAMTTGPFSARAMQRIIVM